MKKYKIWTKALATGLIFGSILSLSAPLYSCGNTSISTITLSFGDAEHGSVSQASKQIPQGSVWKDIKDDINKLAVPDEGYYLVGWKYNGTTNKVEDNHIFNSNTTIDPIFTNEAIKVNFTVDKSERGSVTPSSLQVAKGSKWSDIKNQVTVTESDGWHFDKWIDAKYYYEIKDDTILKDDQTIQARFINEIKINFAVDETCKERGTVSSDQTTFVRGTTWGEVKKYIHIETTQGYDFLAWIRYVNGKIVVLENDDVISSSSEPETINVYALFITSTTKCSYFALSKFENCKLKSEESQIVFEEETSDTDLRTIADIKDQLLDSIEPTVDNTEFHLVNANTWQIIPDDLLIKDVDILNIKIVCIDKTKDAFITMNLDKEGHGFFDEELNEDCPGYIYRTPDNEGHLVLPIKGQKFYSPIKSYCENAIFPMSGYQFDSWYVVNENGEDIKITSEYVIENSITVYPKFIPV